MTGEIECRYYGRDFTAEEMALLRALIAADPQPTRAALSREFCRRIGWLKPDGGLKDMMANPADARPVSSIPHVRRNRTRPMTRRHTRYGEPRSIYLQLSRAFRRGSRP